ncbi:hypothetical protein [Sphingomonas sp. Leaf38]|uniref:hypothetical protein n=1 Tax=Sphingomonas sp. Leaf38 TaxID=1736217 RepID=UPI0006FAAF60|nr:hypothetical protein [Sphingomonas sp. Leaf38]KQN33614.1 hypothetical protein ASE88_00855 [Sphingomonas sp. Leaf38]
MKKIMIFGPTIVAGAVRHTFENPLTVSNKEASRLVLAGVVTGDPEEAEGDHEDDALPTGDGLEAMLVDDLKVLAAAESVDLTGISRKDDIITAIRAHREAASA